MSSKLEITLYMLDYAYQTMKGHFSKLTLAEAIFVPQGGYRSVLGILKHAAGWSHVYRSYAFDPQPQHWAQLDWPHGLRDTIIKSEAYLQDVIDWFDEAHHRWMTDLAQIQKEQLDELRPAALGTTPAAFRNRGHHCEPSRISRGRVESGAFDLSRRSLGRDRRSGRE